MGSTGKLQRGDVVLAHIEDVEATAGGFSFTASSLPKKGRYEFVPSDGPVRNVEVYELLDGPGRPRGKARYA